MTRVQLDALLAFYDLAALPPLAAAHGAGAGAHEETVLHAGVNRLGTFLGISMAGSRERIAQLQAVRAINTSAHIQEHELVPPRGAFPPFFLPNEAGIDYFPEKVAGFHHLNLIQLQSLAKFYGLPQRGAGALDVRLSDLARHIGFRF